MQPIEISDQLYQQAQQRALQAGFKSVDAYVANILKKDAEASAEHFDAFFTPEVIAQLQQIEAGVKAGAKTYSTTEMEAHFQEKSRAWRQNHAH